MQGRKTYGCRVTGDRRHAERDDGSQEEERFGELHRVGNRRHNGTEERLASVLGNEFWVRNEGKGGKGE